VLTFCSTGWWCEGEERGDVGENNLKQIGKEREREMTMMMRKVQHQNASLSLSLPLSLCFALGVRQKMRRKKVESFLRCDVNSFSPEEGGPEPLLISFE
jgi:hypothetical protein